MSKKILTILVAVVASVGFASTSVGATPATSVVTGVITDNSVAVSGASVSVLCNGNTETDTTNAQGAYLVMYPSADCVFGSTVKVTATKGGHSGVATGTVQGITTKLNLAIVNVSIPEYGLIGAGLAGGLGIGLLAYSRRRQLGNSQI